VLGGERAACVSGVHHSAGLDQHGANLTIGAGSVLYAARHDEQLPSTDGDVPVTKLEGQLPFNYEEEASVSAWLCHVNSPWTLTTLIS
jgi:hypothetical protein